jgi:hypothetical protein
MSTILRLIGSIGCVVILLAWGLGLTVATNIARADDCLAQPNSSAPEGSHWYFRIDRATQHKCWYLRAPDQQAQQPDADTTSPAMSTNPVPSEKPETATSQPTATRPIPVEKPKTAASRVRPTTPIPLEKPASASAGAPMPEIPSSPEPPPPHIEMLRVIRKGATDTIVQQDALQQKNTTAITAAPAAEESASQTDQIAEPARAAASAWPDPSTSPMAAHNPIATPVGTPIEPPATESIQPTSDARSAQATAHADPANSPGAVNASVMSEPVEMVVVGALGLVVAGFLFRIAMKIAGARRRRIIVDPSELHWLEDLNEHELRDEHQYAQSVRQREELIDEVIDQPESDWIDDRNEHELGDDKQPSELVHERAKLVDELQGSVVSDDKPRRLFRTDDELQATLQRTGRDPIVADEIGKREDMLEQLKRDLDRLLRSPKVA